MTDRRDESKQDLDWNVLTSPWLEVLDLNADTKVYSLLEALNRASGIRCIVASSPLDLFAVHRFLLTLLYWKGHVAGGTEQVRESLLKGEAPCAVLDALKAGTQCFRLFDDEAPFLQETAQKGEQPKDRKSVGSLLAEFASGSNIAHFHHGDDDNMLLCLRCATIGMLRVVPWTQSGGAGLSPSIHNAPPIMAMASGENLAVTLGLNVSPLDTEPGKPQWSGHFAPTARDAAIPYLEAFTWNPRRIHLFPPEGEGRCWGCGRERIAVVGPILYQKNEATQMRRGKGQRTIPYSWQDPSAFYNADNPYVTVKSSSEAMGASGRDIARLLGRESMPISGVVVANPNHEGWSLVIPCTNPANNKTFDHRQLELTKFSGDAIRTMVGTDTSPKSPQGLDGWVEPQGSSPTGGAIRFIQSATQLLTDADWAILSAAAYREMHDSPAAFDILSGLLWPLRRKVARLPSRNVAWLVLKLMASVPDVHRILYPAAVFCPLHSLPKRQVDERRGDRSRVSPYPVAFPRGRRLEAYLRKAIDRNVRKRVSEPVDWAGLCHKLDQLLD
jgi:hypothetical protein